MFVEPSPNTAIAASSVPRDHAVSAAPAATGTPAPTMANVGNRPTDMSPRCIDPPTPPTQPIERPQISPSTPFGSDAEGERGAVAAIRARDDVGRPGGDGDADGHRFLSVGEMGRAADVAVVVQRLHVLLDPPDLEHPGELLDAALLQRGPPFGGGLGTVLTHDFSSRAHHGAGGRPVSIS